MALPTPLYWKIALREADVLHGRPIPPGHFVLDDMYINLLYLGGLDDIEAARRNGLSVQAFREMKEALSERAAGRNVQVQVVGIVEECGMVLATVAIPDDLPCSRKTPFVMRSRVPERQPVDGNRLIAQADFAPCRARAFCLALHRAAANDGFSASARLYPRLHRLGSQFLAPFLGLGRPRPLVCYELPRPLLVEGTVMLCTSSETSTFTGEYLCVSIKPREKGSMRPSKRSGVATFISDNRAEISRLATLLAASVRGRPLEPADWRLHVRIRDREQTQEDATCFDLEWPSRDLRAVEIGLRLEARLRELVGGNNSAETPTFGGEYLRVDIQPSVRESWNPLGVATFISDNRAENNRRANLLVASVRDRPLEPAVWKLSVAQQKAGFEGDLYLRWSASWSLSEVEIEGSLEARLREILVDIVEEAQEGA